MTVVAFVQRIKDPAGDAQKARMRFEGAVPLIGEAEVVVHNISELGMVLETDEPFAIGDLIDVKLPQSGAVRATVSWGSGRLSGLDFDTPISRVTLDAARLRDAVAIAPEGVDTARHMESFGMRVQRLRRSLGMSQGQLARHMRVSDPAVCGWELNRTRPKPERMDALAGILGVTRTELLGEEATIPLSAQIARARETIARAAGINRDQVKISIEM